MALRSLSTVALRQELERRERGADKLLAKHQTLSARLAEIHAELADLGVDGVAPARRSPGRAGGGRGPGRVPKAVRRPRAKNSLSLGAALAKAVRAGSTVSPAEAGAAVKQLGYASTSKTFGIQVASALAKSADFKKTGRGQYQRKGGTSAAEPRRKSAGRGRKTGRVPHHEPRRRKGPAGKAATPAAAPA